MLGHTLRAPIGNGWKRNLTSVVGWLNCKLHKVKYSLCHLLYTSREFVLHHHSLFMKGRTQTCWTSTSSRQCHTDILSIYNSIITPRPSSIISGRLWRMFGLTQLLQSEVARSSFVLAFRIMRLIIEENGYNSWLATGTPHCNVRQDFIDTSNGIRRKVVTDVDTVMSYQ